MAEFEGEEVWSDNGVHVIKGADGSMALCIDELDAMIIMRPDQILQMASRIMEVSGGTVS